MPTQPRHRSLSLTDASQPESQQEMSETNCTMLILTELDFWIMQGNARSRFLRQFISPLPRNNRRSPIRRAVQPTKSKSLLSITQHYFILALLSSSFALITLQSLNTFSSSTNQYLQDAVHDHHRFPRRHCGRCSSFPQRPKQPFHRPDHRRPG